MPRRQSSRRSGGDKFLNWRRQATTITSTFTEFATMSTDIIVASAAGKTQAWEIHYWEVEGQELILELGGAGNINETVQVQLAHLQGQSAFLGIGSTGYIDEMQFSGFGDGTDTLGQHWHGNTVNGKLGANLMQKYGESEIYVDDNVHYYAQTTYAGGQPGNLIIAFTWKLLASSRLLELLQKYQ